jgi:DNA invertase Pin-like site-specific DNA recombinase
MGGAKRSPPPILGPEALSAHRVHGRRLEGFLLVHRRQDPGQGARQHALAAGRAHHQDVIGSPTRLSGALGRILVAMRTGYSYIRFSTPEQTRGDSYRRQLDLSQRYAQAHGIELDTSLQLNDFGISAFRGHNATSGKLGSFLQAVETGKVKPGSVLLVESLDRLSRSEIMDSLTLFTQLLAKDIAIVTLADSREYTRESINDIGNLVYSLLIMSRSHEESLMKSRRLAAAWEAKRTKAVEGHKMTHKIPAWLRLVDGQFELIPERAELVQRIFTMSKGGMGNALIAKELNLAGIDTWGDGIHQSRKARGWRSSYVMKILKSRAVLGEMTPHKIEQGKRVPQKPIAGYYPRVITDEVFALTRAAIETRRGRGGEVGSVGNLFAHLLKCAQCGGSLVRVNKGKKSPGAVLVCDDGRMGVSQCTWRPWLYDDFERTVLSHVKEIDVDAVFGQSERHTNDLEGHLSAIEMNLADVKAKRERLVDALAIGGEVKSIVDRIRQFESEEERLETSKEALEEQIRAERNKYALQIKASQDIEALLNRPDGAPRDEVLRLRLKLREQIRSLIACIDVWLEIRKPVIRYNAVDFEQKTVVVSSRNKRWSLWKISCPDQGPRWKIGCQTPPS